MIDVTQILNAIEQGDLSSSEQLLPLVYDELRKLPAAKMAEEKPGQTLQANGLVHEAYLRLVDGEKSRGHFFGAAAEAMRRILVEQARRKGRQKRGGDCQRVELGECDLAFDGLDERFFPLDHALGTLATESPRLSIEEGPLNCQCHPGPSERGNPDLSVIGAMLKKLPRAGQWQRTANLDRDPEAGCFSAA